MVWLEQAAKISDNDDADDFFSPVTITCEGIPFSWFPEIGEHV